MTVHRKTIKGLTGVLANVQRCHTGSLRIDIQLSNGTSKNLLMHHSFNNVNQVHQKAQGLIGRQVTTLVSQTTANWAATQFFCDIV